MSLWTPIRNLRADYRAFSVIEVVVAFGLLSVMVAIFFNLIPSSTLATYRAENRLSASNLAQNQLETLRATSFDDLPGWNGKVESLTRGPTVFTVSTEVLPVDSMDPKELQLVKVKVTWTERDKQQSLSSELRVFNQSR